MNVHDKSIAIRNRRVVLQDARQPRRGRPVEADATVYMLWCYHRSGVWCQGLCPECDSRWTLTPRRVRRSRM